MRWVMWVSWKWPKFDGFFFFQERGRENFLAGTHPNIQAHLLLWDGSYEDFLREKERERWVLLQSMNWSRICWGRNRFGLLPATDTPPNGILLLLLCFLSFDSENFRRFFPHLENLRLPKTKKKDTEDSYCAWIG